MELTLEQAVALTRERGGRYLVSDTGVEPGETRWVDGLQVVAPHFDPDPSKTHGHFVSGDGSLYLHREDDQSGPTAERLFTFRFDERPFDFIVVPYEAGIGLGHPDRNKEVAAQAFLPTDLDLSVLFAEAEDQGFGVIVRMPHLDGPIVFGPRDRLLRRGFSEENLKIAWASTDAEGNMHVEYTTEKLAWAMATCPTCGGGEIGTSTFPLRLSWCADCGAAGVSEI